jgi:hypothetical protein
MQKLCGVLASVTNACGVVAVAAGVTFGLVACSSSAPVTTSSRSSTATASAGADATPSASPTTLSAAQTLQLESSKSVIVNVLKGLTGGVEPDPKDVDCIVAKVPPDQINQLITGALGQGKLDPTLIQPVTAAIFSCNPKGLAESVSDGLGVLPSDLTPTQRACVATATLTAIAQDPALLQKITQSTSLSALSSDERSKLVTSLKQELGSCSLSPEITDTILKGIAA